MVKFEPPYISYGTRLFLGSFRNALILFLFIFIFSLKFLGQPNIIYVILISVFFFLILIVIYANGCYTKYLKSIEFSNENVVLKTYWRNKPYSEIKIPASDFAMRISRTQWRSVFFKMEFYEMKADKQHLVFEQFEIGKWKPAEFIKVYAAYCEMRQIPNLYTSVEELKDHII